jgi:hypothetical protein
MSGQPRPEARRKATTTSAGIHGLKGSADPDRLVSHRSKDRNCGNRSELLPGLTSVRRCVIGWPDNSNTPEDNRKVLEKARDTP